MRKVSLLHRGVCNQTPGTEPTVALAGAKGFGAEAALQASCAALSAFEAPRVVEEGGFPVAREAPP